MTETRPDNVPRLQLHIGSWGHMVNNALDAFASAEHWFSILGQGNDVGISISISRHLLEDYQKHGRVG
jgi:hypothetical protein